MPNGNLRLVTGPAAVGKSTIARGLQSEFARGGNLWLLIQLDTFARALPRDWISWSRRQGIYADRGFAYAPAADGSVQLTLGADARSVLAAFHRSVAAVVKSGVNALCETIVYDDDDWSDWADALSGISAHWVRLSAPLAILEARESSDDSRIFRGLARGMIAREQVRSFDVEFDTSIEDADAIVRRIAESQLSDLSGPTTAESER